MTEKNYEKWPEMGNKKLYGKHKKGSIDDVAIFTKLLWLFVLPDARMTASDGKKDLSEVTSVVVAVVV